MDAFFVVVLAAVLLSVAVGAVLAGRRVLALADRPEVERAVDPATERTVLIPGLGGRDA